MVISWQFCGAFLCTEIKMFLCVRSVAANFLRILAQPTVNHPVVYYTKRTGGRQGTIGNCVIMQKELSRSSHKDNFSSFFLSRPGPGCMKQLKIT